MEANPQGRGLQFAREARFGMVILIALAGTLAFVTIRRFSPEKVVVQQSDLRAEALEHFKDMPRSETRRDRSKKAMARAHAASSVAGLDANSHSASANGSAATQLPSRAPVFQQASRTYQNNPSAVNPRMLDAGSQSSNQSADPYAMPVITLGVESSASEIAVGAGIGNPPQSHQQSPEVGVAQTSRPPADSALPPIARSVAPAPASAASANGQFPQTVTIHCDDSFWEISQRVYGTGHYYKALYQYNKAKFDDINTLPVGSRVIAPAPTTLRSKFPRLIKLSCPVNQINFEEEVDSDGGSDDAGHGFNGADQSRQENQPAMHPSLLHDSEKVEKPPLFEPALATTAPVIREEISPAKPLQQKPRLQPAGTFNSPHSNDDSASGFNPPKPVSSATTSKFDAPLSAQPPAAVENQNDFAPAASSDNSGIPDYRPSQSVQQNKFPAVAEPVAAEVADANSAESDIAAKHTTYVVKPGDTLFDIARNELLQASRYLEIMELNRKVLPADVSHLTELPAGTNLQLPANQ